MTAPRIFFETMVRPPYDTWLADPLTEWKAKAAVANADTMAERTFHYWDTIDSTKIAGAQSARDYRDHLRARCPDFGLVWDIHDGHKHYKLNRKNREITSAAQTGVGNMSYGQGDFGDGDFGGVEQVVIELDDGTMRTLAGVMQAVMKMWETELAAMGL